MLLLYGYFAISKGIYTWSAIKKVPRGSTSAAPRKTKSLLIYEQDDGTAILMEWMDETSVSLSNHAQQTGEDEVDKAHPPGTKAGNSIQCFNWGGFKNPASFYILPQHYSHSKKWGLKKRKKKKSRNSAAKQRRRDENLNWRREQKRNTHVQKKKHGNLYPTAYTLHLAILFQPPCYTFNNL